MAETLRVSEPRYTYRILPIDRAARTPALAFTGQDVPAMLTDCDRMVLLAATLGNGLELAIRRAQVRDMSRAVVLDCCGSAFIEAVCDAAENVLGHALTDALLRTLYTVYDHIALPAEVIIELLSYLGRDRGTFKGRDIEREACIWADKGILTTADAQRYLAVAEAVRKDDAAAMYRELPV